jgi:hypothetical protein
MKNILMSTVNKAVNSLKEWTDPSFEGNPYDPQVAYAKPFSMKKLPLFRKKMMWRM